MQKNTLISIIIGLVVIAGAFMAVFGSSLKNLKQETPVDSNPVVVTPTPNPKPNPNPTPSPVPNPTPTPKPAPTPAPTPKPSGHTMADVRIHNSATSCWSAINGNVYDLTNWVNSHPGGRAAILMICGKDGSPLFNSQHGGSGRISNILDQYSIGALN